MKDFRNATISNNFMFRLLMEKPELCRQLLERILDTQISKIVYPEAEKSLEAQLTSKGIRLDIYVTLFLYALLIHLIEISADIPSVVDVMRIISCHWRMVCLNTYGDKHRISRELANFMDYMNGSEPNDDFTRRLQAEVELQRDDDGRRMLYMTYSQTLLEMEAKGIEQGIEQGIEAGMLKTLRDLVKDGMLSPAEAAKRAGMSIEEFGKAVSKL